MSHFPDTTRVELPSDNTKRLDLSLAQDLVHCVSQGHIKPPEHVALPIAVKHGTGITKLVTLLNLFGNGLSATHLAEIEAGMAQRSCSLESMLVMQTSHSFSHPIFFLFLQHFAGTTMTLLEKHWLARVPHTAPKWYCCSMASAVCS